MANRGGKDTAGARPGHLRAPAPGSRLLAHQGFVRIVILSTLLLLAVYTAVAVVRISREPQAQTLENAALPGRAEALAGRVETEGAALRGGLLAARETLQRKADPPLDAAETGLAPLDLPMQRAYRIDLGFPLGDTP